MLDAVTFDFWNTTMWERSGELRAHRLEHWTQALRAAEADVDRERLEAAHDAAHAAYEDAWRSGTQYRVEDAAAEVVAALGLEADPELRRILLEGYDEGGRRAEIAPCPGIRECLEALKGQGIALGIVCDIGLTPSPVVRELLEREQLLGFFDDTTFSDEVGFYKPAPEIFRHALGRLGADPSRSAHVGDRRRTDVAGAQAFGMRGIRYTAVYDDRADDLPEGDAVIDDLRDLPAVLGLAGARR